MNKFVIYINIIASASCVLLAGKFIAMPYIATMIYKDEYKILMFQCDNVMQNHLYAKNKVKTENSHEAELQLNAAEVGLLNCNEYDRMRKKLIRLGLSDNDLSEFGLEAIEENADDVRRFVKTHEIKY